MITYGHQSIIQEDIDAVVEVLKSDFLTQGPVVPKFEQAVATKCKAKFAVAVNSGTSALHVACLALGLGPGDILWTVPNTFVASANCGRYCGADIDFVDIEPLTWNISVPELREKLFQARKIGKVPKVVVPVHFAGQPTEQEHIWELSQEFGFKVLEDASHSLGASRHSEPVGSCRWSHITTFSFHPVKIITTGEGGMALTNDQELAWKMSLFRSHGITRDPGRMKKQPDGPWYYEQLELGFNYRMTDIQAALGLSQLSRLYEFIKKRNEIALRYNEGFRTMPVRTQHVDEKTYSAYHLFVLLHEPSYSNLTRTAVYERLWSKGIGVNLHYMPVHLQPYYRALGFREGLFPVAESYSQAAMTLPLHPDMTEDQQSLVINVLHKVLR